MEGTQVDETAQEDRVFGQPPPQPTQPFGRKKGTACARCRSQKIRCDDIRPSCANCARLGHRCVRSGPPTNHVVSDHAIQVEARLRWLEESLRRLAPEELDKAPAVNHITPFEGGSSLLEPGSWRAHTSQPTQQDAAGDPSNRTLRGGSILSSPDHGPSPGSGHTTTDSPSASTQIGPSEPLAHEVGLLSLANSKESKYLGPSSGVPFARLIFSAVPQSQGLATSWTAPGGTTSRTPAQAEPFPHNWTSEVDLQHFVDAYFQTYQPLYPFLDEDAVADRLEVLFTTQSHILHSLQMPQLAEVEAALSPIHSVQLFLIIALGARILEARLSADFSSERYLATAMQRIDSLTLHDSIEGLQIKLLLALSGFCFENGPNAWFLTSSIIASCLDLGFQRRWMDAAVGMTPPEQSNLLVRKNLRRGIFWSAYSLERMLAVVLGRPLTLRDEAIDVEFPGEGDQPVATPSGSSGTFNLNDDQSSRNRFKRARGTVSPYTAAQYSFRFDQTIAEMKLMLYRVVNLPERFPWPTNTVEWQEDIHKRCDRLLEGLLGDLKWRSRRSTSDISIRSLELKYHHCIMILHRPSPAIPRPSIESWKTCYNSAVKTILINADLHRFSKLTNSWLTAHTIFVSGITFLYCLWVRPEIKNETSLSTFTSNAAACTALLKFLGKMWSVAADAVGHFERLVQLTAHTWRAELGEHSTEVAAGRSLVSMAQSQGNHNLRPERHGYDPAGIGHLPREADDSNLTDMFMGAGQGAEWEPESFYSELGDMSTWFDLNWIANATYSGEGPLFPVP